MNTELEARVAGALGVSSVKLVILPGGVNAAFRIENDAGESIGFLRCSAADAGAEPERPGLSFLQEAAVLRGVHALGFPVPKVLATLEHPEAIIMECARGTSRPDAADSERVAAELMAHIARLHTVPPSELGLSAPATVGEAIRDGLAAWVARARERGLMRPPLLRLAARVLEHTRPHSGEPPRLLQGDVGPGNFMVHEGKLSAIVDWELTHAGDVHEDLAWLWVRGAHTDFGDPNQRLAEYEQAAGRRLDREHLAWHIASATFKSVIGIHSRIANTGKGHSVLPTYLAGLAYEALLGITLGRLVGAGSVAGFLAPDEQPVDEPSHMALLAEQVAAGHAGAPRESQIILKHFADHARQGAWRVRRLGEDAKEQLQAHPDQLDALVDNAAPERFAPLARVLGRHACRIARSLPNAERRVQRGLRIGIGN